MAGEQPSYRLRDGFPFVDRAHTSVHTRRKMTQIEGNSTAVSADHTYFSHLRAGTFSIPHCNACSKHHFFPRVVCPHCGSDQLQWVSPSGRGVVYATTIVRKSSGDYNVCLIDLEEGPRMMSRVVDVAPASVTIGMLVHARIDRFEDEPLLVFSPQQTGNL